MAYFLAALLGGFFAFNAFATPKKAARAMESSLRQMFPGSDVRADVQGKRGRDVLNGRFRLVRVEMSRFSLGAPAAPNPNPGGASTSNPAGALTLQVVPQASSLGRIERFEGVFRDFRWQAFRVASVEMSLDNVRLDWKALRKNSQLKLVSATDASTPRTTGRVRLVLGQDALQTWVREKYPDLQNATVALSSDKKIRVRGTRAILGAQLPFELAGTLNLRQGRVLEIAGVQVLAGGAPLPSLLSAPFTKGLDSIYEIDPQGAWPLQVSDARIHIENVAAASAVATPSLVLDANIALKSAAPLTQSP